MKLQNYNISLAFFYPSLASQATTFGNREHPWKIVASQRLNTVVTFIEIKGSKDSGTEKRKHALTNCAFFDDSHYRRRAEKLPVEPVAQSLFPFFCFLPRQNANSRSETWGMKSWIPFFLFSSTDLSPVEIL